MSTRGKSVSHVVFLKFFVDTLMYLMRVRNIDLKKTYKKN